MTYIAGHSGENTTCSEQSMWYGDISKKSAFGDQLHEKCIGQQLIKKKPEEQENYSSTEKNEGEEIRRKAWLFQKHQVKHYLKIQK